MSQSALSGCTLLCAAAVMAILPAATFAQPATAPAGLVPAGQAAGPAAAHAKLKWSDFCELSLTDGRLFLRSSLSLDMLKSLDGSEREVQGIAGVTSAAIIGRGQYKIVNTQGGVDDQQALTVTSNRYGLTLEMIRKEPGGVFSVQLYQSGSDRRGGRGGDARLVAEFVGGSISVDGSDVATLRQEHPHEANRYLRPLLRKLGSDLFQIELPAARQVLFSLDSESTDPPPATRESASATREGPATRPATEPATQPTVPPKVVAQVQALVKDLDAPTFARREAAADQLARLGPPAVIVLNSLDRDHLSAQQALTIDLLTESSSPLPPDKARRLRSDPHFLFDCLYLPDNGVRAAAIERLGIVVKTPVSRFVMVLAIDPAKDADRLGLAIEKLRDELIPKEKQ